MTTTKFIFSYQIGDDSSFFEISEKTALRMARLILLMETSEDYCHFEIHPHVGQFKKLGYGEIPLCSVTL